MTKLTIKELEALTTANIGNTIRDDGGLRGKVRANAKAKNGVSVTFTLRFKWQTISKDFPCGTWPNESISTIRANRDLARAQIAKKIDPSIQKVVARRDAQKAVAEKLALIESEKNENSSVQDLFDAWVKDGVRRKDGNAELRRSFSADVLPKIGKIHIKKLTESELREVLRAMVVRGVNRSAVAMRNNLTQMFLWAEKRQPWRKLMADGNPMSLIEIEKIVSAGYDMSNQRTRTLSADEIRQLQCIFRQMQVEYENASDKRVGVQPVERKLQHAIWLMISTMCRVGELSMARWEHINFSSGEWFIPRENVKGKVGDLKVYLSEFAIEQFRQLKEITGKSEWCFPAKHHDGHTCTKSMTKQIGDRQMMFKKGRDGKQRKPMKNRRSDDTLVLGYGKSGAWTPHDLRRTGATMMQSFGISLDVIDRCQNHVLHGSKVRRHYLHHDYADEQRDAWRRLGERLSLILNPTANVVLIRQKGA